MINTKTKVKELVLKGGKCYGILEKDGEEMGFVLKGEIFAHMKINTESEGYCPYDERWIHPKAPKESANILLTTCGDKNGTLFALYNLNECFMEEMKNKNNN